MCKYFVQKFERSTPNKTGQIVYGYLLSEIEAIQFEDMAREASPFISYEIEYYNSSFKEVDARGELLRLVLEFDKDVKGCDLAYAEYSFEIGKIEFNNLLRTARYQYEHED